MRPLLLLLASIFLLLGGCATAQRPAVSLTPPASNYVAAQGVTVNDVAVSVVDQRADWSLDSILAKKGSDEVADVVRAAVTHAKIANVSADAAAPLNVDITLTKLEWFVPGYQAMLKKVFATSFLTGGIGGVAYGSTSTPVHGYATLRVRVRHGATELLDREYVGDHEESMAKGDHEESMAKLKCDSVQTKSRMVSVALGKAVDALVQDLAQAVAAPPVADKPAATAGEHAG